MISVKVEGPVGLDEPQDLLEELGRETGLAWRLETAGQKGTLGGELAVTMLEALLGGVAGAVVQVAVQRAVDNWRGRRLDPPIVTIVVQPPQAPQPARDPEPPQPTQDPEPPQRSDDPEGS
ncbi:hypothetical protein GCM10017771_35100 [Streptomyces capitiformicae]|uniref:Uncharacterized protein n=2 Tax=Streptomyces capitiformicae TaxID=2014920 RepID=A0A919GQ02_9ACTN|nr:hypothetical protein GCM10017771_35100 [Streptomyces capitiformicae]